MWWVTGEDDRRARFVVGKDGQGISELAPGRYVFDLKYNEVRRYGALKISKVSNARRTFFIQ